MPARYVLNFREQLNGDNEIHKEGCTYFPVINFEELGEFNNCSAAVVSAKLRYPFRKINGCFYCMNGCHSR